MARLVLGEAMQRVPFVRGRYLRALHQAAHRFGPTVILFAYDYLLPTEVASLRRSTGAKIVLWFPDSIVNLRRLTVLHAPYDAVFSKDPYVVRMFDGLAAAPFYYLPEACNPRVHRPPDEPYDGTPYACDVATAGNLHAHRVAVFKHLADFGVKLWGNPPPAWLDAGPVRAMYTGRYVTGIEKARAFRGAAVVLNTLHPTEVWGVNARTFEAAGIGAFQMVDARPGLASLFNRDEIVTFDGVADLRAKLRHFLGRPDERAAIAAAGQARAYGEHTYAHRLGTLLRTLDGRARGIAPPPIRCLDTIPSSHS